MFEQSSRTSPAKQAYKGYSENWIESTTSSFQQVACYWAGFWKLKRPGFVGGSNP
jgi:hypothetical protein